MPTDLKVIVTINLKDGSAIRDIEASATTLGYLPEAIRSVMIQHNVGLHEYSSILVAVAAPTLRTAP